MTAFWQYLNTLDGELLLLINNCNAPFFDQFFYSYSGRFIWSLLYVAIIAYCILRWRKQGIWLVLAVIACVVLADQISAHLIKPLVCRLRPTHDNDISQYVHLVNEYRGGLYGFVSSHAANCFAIATLMCLATKDKIVSWTLFVWAAINAYSRMYLGVHYPGDIVCGTALGVAIAVLIYYALRKSDVLANGDRMNDYKHNISYILPVTFLSTVIYLVVHSLITCA